MSSKLSDFISEKNIVMDLHAKTRDEAIHQLALILQQNGSVSDADDFYHDVLHRESLTTTGIGNNIAIPHGKSTSVIQSTMLFAKNSEPLAWHSLDGSEVNIIFLMAVSPESKGDAHLRMLAKLSGKLMDDDFVKAIKSAQTSEEILKILKS
ncbi:PTS sugar transporter subunit IIA [Pediococcus ethanolidurans]|uniref:PTS system, fructose-specific IIA component n=2 Tax=Pediococcus ethanolidurans TaxID=319653 RepID=A0A1H9L1I7_9LACO|nr:fructose PTS transporter subunit IIA [Pediococcus ethanolidurans]MBU7564364.1 fructose PTS transporter subunit IIA [Pediococcus ethanolidurans]MCV3322387.1 fructose PTS transporter subunit IIA [Pediococcus ethanolidurans]MCV3324449.1 fructose PTS transporter subunit IIA [Pediococcus ethanolidurans]MCV3555859.1 fructose PTS transporter subunit IIA [Pediococcus ethanolidurans]MDV7718301.1 PTS mannose transporter subunit IIAB [Pediococcus ethanolidurans]